jgi:hypothetical protein
VDWVLIRQDAEPTVAGIRLAMDHWPAGQAAARRKQQLFTDVLLSPPILSSWVCVACDACSPDALARPNDALHYTRADFRYSTRHAE